MAIAVHVQQTQSRPEDAIHHRRLLERVEPGVDDRPRVEYDLRLRVVVDVTHDDLRGLVHHLTPPLPPPGFAVVDVQVIVGHENELLLGVSIDVGRCHTGNRPERFGEVLAESVVRLRVIDDEPAARRRDNDLLPAIIEEIRHEERCHRRAQTRCLPVEI